MEQGWEIGHSPSLFIRDRDNFWPFYRQKCMMNTHILYYSNNIAIIDIFYLEKVIESIKYYKFGYQILVYVYYIYINSFFLKITFFLFHVFLAITLSLKLTNWLGIF